MTARFEGIEISERGEPAATPDGQPPHWRVHDIGTPLHIGQATVTAFDVYHGSTRCLAYRVSAGPAVFVFCTDHEFQRGHDPDDPRQRRSLAAEAVLGEHCRGANLAYFDGQYLLDEYTGRAGIGLTAAVPRLDWGHSCVEDVQRRCHDWGVNRALIGHHDPERSWRARRALELHLHEAAGNRVELAKAEMVIEI